MTINHDQLKAKLQERLLDRSQYQKPLTLNSVLTKALSIALAVVDELATVEPRSATRVYHRPEQGREDDPRHLAANEKRGRILKVMRQVGKPMRASQIGRKAMLTPGENAYLLRTTPGVVQVGKGLFALAGNDE